MFLIDQPYVSEFLKKTLKEFNIPVVNTDAARYFDLDEDSHLVPEDDAIKLLKNQHDVSLYTTSENSISWISKALYFSELPGKIDLFKDKFKFRELTKSLFPDFYYKKIKVEELKTLNLSEIPVPFIIKPTVGFFSMGVYKVSNHQEWLKTIQLIDVEIKQLENLYPEEVLDTDSFIIEQIIQGEEFAIDAYFNVEGEGVIVGIFQHVFSSDADVSDRVYITSKNIIEENLDEFSNFINSIGKLSGVKNFPVHVELRRDDGGKILPIEVNPMRFGGWCTTADVTYLAYGFNPYQYYYSSLKPDWSTLLKVKQGKVFSIIVLDNSTGIEADDILSFDYESLVSCFEKPLELRKINYKKYPVFGFLFTETRDDNYAELNYILNSNLTEFLSV